MGKNDGYIHKHIYRYIYSYLYTLIYIYTYTYTCPHIHLHTHMQICIYTCRFICSTKNACSKQQDFFPAQSQNWDFIHFISLSQISTLTVPEAIESLARIDSLDFQLVHTEFECCKLNHRPFGSYWYRSHPLRTQLVQIANKNSVLFLNLTIPYVMYILSYPLPLVIC